MTTARKYKSLVPDYGVMITLEDWKLQTELGFYSQEVGTGYWVRNGKQSYDGVFDTPAGDATHVVWYPK